MSPLDLHVLGTPPAFVLSQDQTLVFNPSVPPLFLRFAPSRSLRFPSGSVPFNSRNLLSFFLCAFLFYIVFKVRSAPSLRTPSGAPRERACLGYQKSPILSTPFFQKIFLFLFPFLFSLPLLCEIKPSRCEPVDAGYVPC